MKRMTIFALAAALCALTACDRASEEDCRTAVLNIYELTEIDKTGTAGPDKEAAIRSCRANASRAAVQCMIAAKSLADLEACEGGLAEQQAAEDAKQGTATDD